MKSVFIKAPPLLLRVSISSISNCDLIKEIKLKSTGLSGLLNSNDLNFNLVPTPSKIELMFLFKKSKRPKDEKIRGSSKSAIRIDDLVCFLMIFFSSVSTNLEGSIPS